MSEMAVSSSSAETSRVLVAQGACSTGPRAPWLLGRWHLDGHRLEFSPPSRARHVRVHLDKVCRLETTRRRFLVTSKRVLKVTYLPSASSRPSRLWLLTGDLPAWESELAGRASGMGGWPDRYPSRQLVALTRALDLAAGTTAQILDLLATGLPTTSATLAALLEFEARDAWALESVVSARFADVDEALGAPALRYVRRRFHVPTAKVYEMSWWLDDRVATAWQVLHSSHEVHVGADEVVAIITIPTESSETLPSVRVEAGGHGLVLGGVQGYERYVPLPVAVHADIAVTVPATGMLVAVARRRDRPADMVDR